GRRYDRAAYAAPLALPAAALAAPPLSARCPGRRSASGGHDARGVPAHASCDAGGDRRLGRRLQALRRGHRSQLSRDEGRLGALVGAGGGRPPRIPGRDRQALLHAPESVAPARDAALPAQASRAVARAAVTSKYGPQAERWTDDAYADAASYLAHRAELIVGLGPRLEPGDTVLDLACGDG